MQRKEGAIVIIPLPKSMILGAFDRSVGYGVSNSLIYHKEGLTRKPEKVLPSGQMNE